MLHQLMIQGEPAQAGAVSNIAARRRAVAFRVVMILAVGFMVHLL
jgi:hypothetical protein